MSKKHNGIISFWKFVFCMMIVIFHAGEFYRDSCNVLFYLGSIGVEFFFIVSGYLMAKKAFSKNTENNNDNIYKETFLFIWNKFKKFFPYILICFLLDIILRTITHSMSIQDYILSIFDLIPLNMAGFRGSGLLGQVWYISALLISMALIYPQIRKFKDKYFYFIAPLTIILLGGFLSYNYFNLRAPLIHTGLFYKGLLRGYLEICLGSVLYPLSLKLKQINFTKLGSLALTIFEIFSFIFVLAISNFSKNSNYDFVILFILALAIMTVFSEKTLELKIFNNKFFYFLEKISLPLYLVNVPIRTYLYTFNISYPKMLTIMTFTSIILGILLVIVVEFFQKRNFYIPKLKKLIIN